MNVLKGDRKLKKKYLFWLVLLAIIVLPTGTIEDLFTTIPLINLLGIKLFLLVCFGLLWLLFVTGVDIGKEVKKIIG